MSSQTTSVTGALDTPSESLLPLAAEQFGGLLPFVPDTPWTTGVLHVLQRRHGKVFVDSPMSPRNLVVVAQGDPAWKTLDRAFLFGVSSADALKTYIAGIRTPTEIVCDPEVEALVREHHPECRRRESIVHWYERVEDAQAVQADAGAKRLRISDSETIAPLVPGWALRTFRTVRDLVTGGSAFVVEENGRHVGAAFTVDHSVKYERIAVSVEDAARRRGLGTILAKRLVKCVADQARIPVAVVDRRDEAGLRTAEKLGFNRKAVMPVLTTRLKGI